MSHCLDPLVEKFAEKIVASCCRRGIRYFQSLKRESMQSGADSGLDNVWDEVCVLWQGYGPPSLLWRVYVETMEHFFHYLVRDMAHEECAAVWLLTDEGEDWLGDDEFDGDRHDIPWYKEDLVRFLASSTFDWSTDWSNKRIRAHLEHDKGF